jgi:hypothetical protein
MLCCAALQVDDAQHPRNERYDDLPDDHLAVPRNSIEIDHILENKNFTRDGEPIPVHRCPRLLAASFCLLLCLSTRFHADSSALPLWPGAACARPLRHLAVSRRTGWVLVPSLLPGERTLLGHKCLAGGGVAACMP